jgi:hypothetical protein
MKNEPMSNMKMLIVKIIEPIPGDEGYSIKPNKSIGRPTSMSTAPNKSTNALYSTIDIINLFLIYYFLDW